MKRLLVEINVVVMLMFGFMNLAIEIYKPFEKKVLGPCSYLFIFTGNGNFFGRNY